MADDERRAEIDLRLAAYKLADGSNKDELAVELLRTRAALDRFRDARGDDEVGCPYCHEPVEDGPAFVDGETGRSLWHLWCWNHDQTMSGLSPEEAARERKRARSPQGEDHEDRYPANGDVAILLDTLRDIRGFGPQSHEVSLMNEARRKAEEALLAHQASVPSRDGTVAVEDVERWLRDRASPNEHKVADAFVAEFSPASTGDQAPDGQ